LPLKPAFSMTSYFVQDDSPLGGSWRITLNSARICRWKRNLASINDGRYGGNWFTSGWRHGPTLRSMFAGTTRRITGKEMARTGQAGTGSVLQSTQCCQISCS
jgi:hypothetical protein